MPFENDMERGAERIPTKQEVFEVISRFAKNAIIVKELSNEEGLYLLEVKVEEKESGNFTQYEYMRKGRHPDHNEISVTNIYFMSYENDVAVGGIEVAVYSEETGIWKEMR